MQKSLCTGLGLEELCLRPVLISMFGVYNLKPQARLSVQDNLSQPFSAKQELHNSCIGNGVSPEPRLQILGLDELIGCQCATLSFSTALAALLHSCSHRFSASCEPRLQST